MHDNRVSFIKKNVFASQPCQFPIALLCSGQPTHLFVPKTSFIKVTKPKAMMCSVHAVSIRMKSMTCMKNTIFILESPFYQWTGIQYLDKSHIPGPALVILVINKGLCLFLLNDPMMLPEKQRRKSFVGTTECRAKVAAQEDHPTAFLGSQKEAFMQGSPLN